VKVTPVLSVCVILSLVVLVGCTSKNQPAPSAGPASGPKVAAALPDNAFKAQIGLTDAPAKMRAGEKVTVQVKVTNASDVMWYARGGEINTNQNNRFYLAAGNRWLQPDGKLVTNMDGRYGLDKNLKPGEATTIPLQVTAPRNPGEYLLDIDLVQEQVAWFSDKGSSTAKTKITVVR
jgi:hypothetical protein